MSLRSLLVASVFTLAPVVASAQTQTTIPVDINSLFFAPTVNDATLLPVQTCVPLPGAPSCTQKMPLSQLFSYLSAKLGPTATPGSLPNGLVFNTGSTFRSSLSSDVLALGGIAALDGNGSLNAPIGGTTPAAGAFTTLSGSVTATGSTTAQTLADWFSYRPNVKAFGAALDGTTSDQAAYTAAVTATPLNGTIYVPPGRQNLTAVIHAGPAGPVLWDLSGTTIASGAAPVIGISRNSDVDNVKNFLSGGTTYYAKTNSATAGYSGPILRLDVNDNINGLSGGEIDGFLVNRTIAPTTFTSDVLVGITSNVMSAGGFLNSTGLNAYNKRVSASGEVFGANLAIFDQTGLPALTAGAAVSTEFDIEVNGADASGAARLSFPGLYGTRIGEDIIAASVVPSSDFSIYSVSIVNAGTGLTNGTRTFTVVGGTVDSGLFPAKFTATVSGGVVQAGTIAMLNAGAYTASPSGAANAATVDSGTSNATFSFTPVSATAAEVGAGIRMSAHDSAQFKRGFDFGAPYERWAFGTVYAAPVGGAAAFGMAMGQTIAGTDQTTSENPTFGPSLSFSGTAANGNVVLSSTGTGTVMVGAVPGVSCPAGTVNLTTLVVTKGFVTHC